MGRIVNNNKTESVGQALTDLCCDIYQGEYVLVLGGDVVLKPEYAGGNSQEYIKSEFENTHKERNKWEMNSFLKKDWKYDVDTDVSEDLIDLLSTRCFPVVLTTTFDGYIEAVMKKDDIYGKELRVMNIYDKNNSKNFLPGSEYGQIPPTLYYAFGKADSDSRLEYVYSENDAIKLIARWLGNDAPTDLIKYLKKKKVLAIGCKFDDWYFRFFWYCLRQNFEDLKGDVAISLQANSESDRKLRDYLRSINVDDKGNAREFLHELSRWLNDPAMHVYSKYLSRLQTGGVFISYASEDFPIVCQIYAVLAEKGIPVWFDNAQLHGGDRYDNRIRDAIGQCTVFMPILSRQVLKDLNEGNWRYYKDVEWTAIDDNKRSRIVPVTLQGFDIKTERERLPEAFRDKSVVNWTKEGRNGILNSLRNDE